MKRLRLFLKLIVSIIVFFVFLYYSPILNEDIALADNGVCYMCCGYGDWMGCCLEYSGGDNCSLFYSRPGVQSCRATGDCNVGGGGGDEDDVPRP